jgi:NADPH:quinone reductase-like Zn-dependent oxidoreductase
MKYKNVVLTKRGGPEVLQIVECELSPPTNRQVQIKILACGLGRTDVAMRYGYYPFAPKIPFVPGYEIVGIVKAIGHEVTEIRIGDTVAALTVYGGYSEYINLNQEHLVKVPDELDPGESVTLILNYTTAYQMLERVAKVQQGNKILITGASGGVGTALLDLGKLKGLKMYGTASKQKHEIIERYEATPIDYKSEDIVEAIRKLEPNGLDFVFDGIGKSYIGKSFSLLKKRGKLVEYGYPDFQGMIRGLLKIGFLNALPNNRKAEFYGISGSYKKNRSIILNDLESLFVLLKENKIKPIISKRMSLLEASEANRILESGSVSGKIVLMAPELLR